ncbi:hypothetical protein QN277_011603 [Acacia crassicarpa]|uniref:CREG-like beta-barrel domain-containing protein n=1 Tax=Acacia crassicarpa TaxID=499986 RepID=A0AAE1MZG5_9FABA|nr:hypothetical protein QN277_011603 [Acacia crassicarpa]
MKSHTLTFAEKCKNILASSWQGYLNTIKADVKGSKSGIYTSKVKYIIRRGKPYIWVSENDLHNVNAMIDERGSFAVTTPFPGPLAGLLKALERSPARVALVGDVVPLSEDKAKSLAEKLEQVVLSEAKAMKDFTYEVSGVLSSSLSRASRSDNLKEILGDVERYSVYKFEMSSCMYIDGHGGNFEVNVEDVNKSKADPLASFSAKLIDGINQSEARRRALVLFCLVYMNALVKDAYVMSVDRKGFDVLGKLPNPVLKDGAGRYQWKEFRFLLKEEASDVESFCRQLVEMEEEAIKKVSSFSGLA